MGSTLSDRQRALLVGLQDAERAGGSIDLSGLAAATGYSESSIKTYFSKRLLGVLVHRDDAGGFVARGAIRCSEEAFAHRMTQKAQTAGAALQTEESWRELVRKLLREGSRRGFRLSADEQALIDELVDEPGPPQTSLF